MLQVLPEFFFLFSKIWNFFSPEKTRNLWQNISSLFFGVKIMPNFPGMENQTPVSTLFSNVGWASIFSFVNNCRFKLFKYFRIKEPPVLWFEEKKVENQVHIESGCFQNLKELSSFMKELTMK
jgi:hypothetical protein